MKYKMEYYPDGAIKVYHTMAGDVIQRVFNDGTPPDPDYYMIYDHKSEAHSYAVNLRTGKTVKLHVSSRCLKFKNAVLCPHGVGDNG